MTNQKYIRYFPVLLCLLSHVTNPMLVRTDSGCSKRDAIPINEVTKSILNSIPSTKDPSSSGIWISALELKGLPESGPAWERLLQEANRPVSIPNLSDKKDPTNVQVMAKALVFARTGIEKYRQDVIKACIAAIGTEKDGCTLALGRELAAYIIAADLVKLPESEDKRFCQWLLTLQNLKLCGKTLKSTHETRPNNWGTQAGASLAAIAVYINDKSELNRIAKIFKGWLGDRKAYTGFKYGALSWQADSKHPVGINPKGATKDGHSIDGVLPDDQRRNGNFKWPPPKENYVYGALQGALAQAIILYRAGFDVWNWENQALLRAFKWLHQEAKFPPKGDDRWEAPIIDYYYETSFWDGKSTRPGKNVGWTCWTHQNTIKRQQSSE